MARRSALLVTLVGLVLVVVACNGGSTLGPGDDTPTARPRETPTQRPSPSPVEQKTPPAQESPTATAVTTTPDATPTAPATPAAEGTPAVAPADLSRYQGQTINEEECLFDPRTAVVSCPGRGTYAVDPPLVGQDISCSALIVQGDPEVIRCSSQEPLQTVYYDIQ